MKKIALATILAAASIVASAQVSVSGAVRTFADRTTTGSSTVNSMVNDSSRIAFSATEKLANGASVRAVLDTAVAATDPTTGASTQIGNRQSTIGITASGATVELGRNLNSYFLAIANTDAFTTDYGTIAGDVHNFRTIRSGSAAFASYTAGPVTVAVDRTFADTATDTTTYSIVGKLGPVTGTVSQYQAGTEKSMLLAAQASYAGVALTASHGTSSGAAGDKVSNLLGASMKLGSTPVTIKGSYGVATGSVVAYNLGADYALSKRTGVSVAYRNVDAATDVKSFGVGLTHSF